MRGQLTEMITLETLLYALISLPSPPLLHSRISHSLPLIPSDFPRNEIEGPFQLSSSPLKTGFQKSISFTFLFLHYYFFSQLCEIPHFNTPVICFLSEGPVPAESSQQAEQEFAWMVTYGAVSVIRRGS